MKTRAFEHLLTTDIAEHFWSYVWVRSANECWPFVGGRDTWNYGLYNLKVTQDCWMTVHANRVAWALKNGSIPQDQIIRHTCNYPPCCNPGHLVPGTEHDNNQDSLRARRYHPKALSEEVVWEIRHRLGLGQRGTQIAQELGVSKTTVSQIKNGRRWSHLK